MNVNSLVNAVYPDMAYTLWGYHSVKCFFVHISHWWIFFLFDWSNANFNYAYFEQIDLGT